MSNDDEPMQELAELLQRDSRQSLLPPNRRPASLGLGNLLLLCIISTLCGLVGSVVGQHPRLKNQFLAFIPPNIDFGLEIRDRPNREAVERLVVTAIPSSTKTEERASTLGANSPAAQVAKLKSDFAALNESLNAALDKIEDQERLLETADGNVRNALVEGTTAFLQADRNVRSAFVEADRNTRAVLLSHEAAIRNNADNLRATREAIRFLSLRIDNLVAALSARR
jgi:hypothetical protein